MEKLFVFVKIKNWVNIIKKYQIDTANDPKIVFILEKISNQYRVVYLSPLNFHFMREFQTHSSTQIYLSLKCILVNIRGRICHFPCQICPVVIYCVCVLMVHQMKCQQPVDMGHGYQFEFSRETKISPRQVYREIPIWNSLIGILFKKKKFMEIFQGFINCHFARGNKKS